MKASRKSIILIIATGIVVYVSSLVTRLPAALAYQWAHPFLKGITLERVSGTLWSGQVDQIMVQNTPQPLHLPKTTWHINPAALLTGKLSAHVQMGSLSSPVESDGLITLSTEGLTLTDFQADTSASWLSGLLPHSTIVGELSARINLSIDNLRMQGNQCQDLAGNITVTQGQFTSSVGNFDLGTSKIALSCQSQQLMAMINQFSPELTTEASLSLSAEGRYSIKGTVSQGSNTSDTLQQGLKMLGRPDADGDYPINWQGRI